MDNDRYSPSAPAALDLPEVEDEQDQSVSTLPTASNVPVQIEPANVASLPDATTAIPDHSTAQDAIENIDQLEQVEAGLDDALMTVVEPGNNAHQEQGNTGKQDSGADPSRSTPDQGQVFDDAAQLEAELEKEIAEIPEASASTLPPHQPQASGYDGEDEDAEGEIDMDYVHDELTEAPALETPSAPQSSEQQEAPVSTEPTFKQDAQQAQSSDSASATPAQVEAKQEQPASPTAIRRRPEQQRRSPSYSLDAKPTEASTAPPFQSTGLGAKAVKASLPGKPPGATGSRLPRSASSGNAGPAQKYASKFSFDNVVFPEGITASSPSVTRHPALASSWAESNSQKSATFIAQSSLALFDACRADGDVDGVRAWYQTFSKDNPTATGPMLDLINFELAHGNFPQVVALYEKALRGLGGSVGAVPGTDIWASYLHYIRRQNPIPSATSPNASSAPAIRETVVRAYELALSSCGHDIASGPIWREYIGFLGERESNNTWEKQGQTDEMRKVYWRALAVPTGEVEAIWKEYDAFENGINKLTAKKFLAERSPVYMTARTVLRDLRSQLEPLNPPAIPPRPTRSDSDRALVIAWKKYLKWEESNPLDIEEASVLSSRVSYSLKKCLTTMRFFPEFWHQAAVYWQGLDKSEEGLQYLKTGLEANPTSFLLTFALAEQEEIKGHKAEARAAYEALLKTHGAEIDKLKDSITEEVEAAQGPEIESDDADGVNRAADDDDMEGAGVELSETQKKKLEREQRGTAVREKRQKELDDLVTAAGVIWIMYMRFARRTEGLRAARGIFSAARKSAHVSWHVYESSAHMEYHCNKDSTIATKIFELGLKAFPDQVDFATKFLEFQIEINDSGNARALFERLVLRFPAEKARPIWDAWSRYEYLYGDIESAQKLDSRLKEAYPNDAPLRRFAARFAYDGIDEIASRDLGFGVKRESAAAAASIPAGPLIKRAREDSPTRSSLHLTEAQRFPPQPLGREPPPKRQRGFSPAPPPPPPAQNMQQRRNGDGRRRDFSPPPMRSGPGMGPPMQAPSMSQPGLERDASGLPKSVVWFLGNLPRARLFDGPTFKPEDMMDVISRANLSGGPSGHPSMLGGPGGPSHGGPPGYGPRRY